jgi:hypothetical protein
MIPQGEVPAVVDYGKLYGDNYYGRGERTPDTIARYGLESIVAVKMPQARAAAQLIQRFKKTGRLLDVGCSAGVFVKAAREVGFDASGIDLSAVAVQFAREQLGVDAHVTSLEEAKLDSRRFDVITLWDVIEHFEDPWHAMQLVKDMQPEDGIVALRTPNTRCLRTVLKGFRGWDMISPPEHYHLFARKSLELFLKGFGYRIVYLATVHSHWIYYRHAHPLAKTPFHLSGAMGLGGDLVAIARRN